jgi:2'-5' RNA ligase
LNPLESALVVLIPESESLVGDFRARYDPAAGWGVPAHITLLYPFQPPESFTPELFSRLQNLFAGFPAFAVAFTEMRRFPEVLYLAPAPATPFQQLSAAIVNRFPDTPPYGGQFPEVIPHLTIAQLADPARLQSVGADFERAAQGRLPIQAQVSEVALLDNTSGLWQTRRKFGLMK